MNSRKWDLQWAVGEPYQIEDGYAHYPFILTVRVGSRTETVEGHGRLWCRWDTDRWGEDPQWCQGDSDYAGSGLPRIDSDGGRLRLLQYGRTPAVIEFGPSLTPHTAYAIHFGSTPCAAPAIPEPSAEAVCAELLGGERQWIVADYRGCGTVLAWYDGHRPIAEPWPDEDDICRARKRAESHR